jgi:hypothetical protein
MTCAAQIARGETIGSRSWRTGERPDRGGQLSGCESPRRAVDPEYAYPAFERLCLGLGHGAGSIHAGRGFGAVR